MHDVVCAGAQDVSQCRCRLGVPTLAVQSVNRNACLCEAIGHWPCRIENAHFSGKLLRIEVFDQLRDHELRPA
jgi:hypothetical protein